ncbi:hypothetical protein [Pengzhenrongella frigida]|uniref:Uncharacterized protein n=1 Tax=Pengzhenrongella frigida TaxID=1259133 RepID=A0A4Q5MZ55_9MICO|nr:hypothetical protein [Cellulomonas sp. HLT2-17]RYV51005.1 hypothetical protein EUA98_10885 [Cellulomonas sp. HLT2-17]
MTIATRAVGIDELRRAWCAVQEGQFLLPRPTERETVPRPTAPAVADDRTWHPGETVLPVVGCLPQAGATSLALAIATHEAPARVIECSPPTASGLAGAATAELGTTSSGWIVGRRDQVHLARPGTHHRDAGLLPLPDDAATGTSLSVLDVGWELGQLMALGGWLSATVDAAPRVVLVGTATVPGLRRLETTLNLLDPARAIVAVRGSDPRRWPHELTTAMGPATGDQHRAGRWVVVPHDKRLALRGIDSKPLPPALVAAGREVLRHVSAAGHPQRGNS